MMQSMRDNMKLVIWITAIVFMVGFGILQLGGVLSQPQTHGPTGVIAEVNGEPIRYSDFERVYKGMADQVRQQRELQEGEDSYIREQAWQEILRNTLMMQAAKRYHITVTPEEVKASIRYSPPSILMQAPAFQTNGRFDYKKYIAELENPNSQLPWDQVAQYVTDMLPMQKLQEIVTARAKVSEGDLHDRFLLTNEKLDLNVMRFDPDSFAVDTSKVGGADVETYYKAHSDEFSGPPEAILAVGLVRRAPNEADFSAARERMQGILDQVKALPDSFPHYARTYSELETASRGGEAPGDAYLTDLHPEFRDAFRNLKQGEISGILRSTRSLHIFKVEKRYTDPTTKKDKYHYREIAIVVYPGADAVQAARRNVDAFIKEAHRDGVLKTATRMGVQATTTGWFTEGHSGNDVFDRFPEIETWVFKARIGSVSRPVPYQSGWFVYQILDRHAQGLRPLASITDRVRTAVIRSLRMERAKAAAEQARAAVLAGMAPKDAAAKFGGRLLEAKGVTRNGFMGLVGHDAEIAGQLMTFPTGEWGPVLTGDPGALVPYVENHVRPSEEDFKKEAPQLRQNMLQEKRQVLFTEWMQDLRKRAKVQDYRENFFEV